MNGLKGMDLNRAIAKARGWRELRDSSGWYETPDNAWDQAIMYGIPPGRSYEIIVPDWAYDVDAAVKLCLDVCAKSDPKQPLRLSIYSGLVELRRAPLGNIAGVADYAEYYTSQDDLALALARLALAALRGGQ